jgi:subtilisin-like proprotein convertase family protein
MKTIFLLGGILLSSLRPLVAADILTETFTMSTAVTIPDADLSGILQTITPTVNISSLDLVTVTLNTTGGWNGDLYAYLWHEGTLSVLVNRPGRTTANPDGSATSGMNLTLADSAATDLHLAPGALSGTFQPDGRDLHPLLSMDTSVRTDALSDFLVTAPGGEWRLFIADVAGGEEATLVSWSISLTGPAIIPEPSIGLLGAAAALSLLRRRRSNATL